MLKIIKRFKFEHWLIIFIVLLSLLLRLFKISSYMTFLGDEGRDALVWLRMVKDHKMTLIGPMTSIGNMYLGPLFYYLMLPFYILMGTAGPSIGTALFAGATTFMLWFFGKEWFSVKVGLIAAFFYAISPVAIELSRSSWNPNIMPFFALLIIWGIWQFWEKDKFYWLAIEGVLLSFAVQSHYLGLLLVPVVFLFFFVKLFSLLKQKSNNWKKLCLNFLLLNTCFLILTLMPLIWFDLRHDFLNYKSFYKFFSERQTTVNLKAYKAIPQIWPLWKMFVSRLLGGKNEIYGFWISIILGIGIVFSAIKTFAWCAITKSADSADRGNLGRDCFVPIYIGTRNDKSVGFIVLFSWLIIGLLGMGLYKQHIYDHYFGFLFPAVFLMTAVVLEKVWNYKPAGKIVATAVFILLAVLNITASPLKYPPNRQMQKTKEISEKIVDESNSKPFNLGLIAKQNYDPGYRYFLEKWGHKALEIDSQKYEQTLAEQLFVVCEIDDCRPIGHAQAEIANFGWAEIEQEWGFDWGTKLFKLVHYSE